MLRKLVMIGVLAALAGMVVGGASLATAEGHRHATTLTLKSTTIDDTDLNLGPRSFGVGDQFLFRERLRTTEGKRVGTAHGVCSATEVNERAQRVSFRCGVTFVFGRHTSIDVSGVVTFSPANEGKPFFLPLTGGSGRYIGVEGELRVLETSDTTSIYRFRFVE